MKLDYVEPGIARCAEPITMKDKLILSTPAAAFQCKGKNIIYRFKKYILFNCVIMCLINGLIVIVVGRVGNDILAKCDACYTFPCQNGGKCAPMPERHYECRCAPGYHGHHCEYMIDACYGNPCRNGATCKVLEEGRFRYKKSYL